MTLTRRKFAVLGSSCALAACVGPKLELGREKFSPAMVINGNMVLSPQFDGVLTDEVKNQLRKTGLTAIKISIGGSAGTYAQTREQIDYLDGLIADNPDVLMRVDSYAALQAAQKNRQVGFIYSFEAATMLNDNPGTVAEFAARGVKIMQPGYNNANAFGAGVMSTEPPLGLSVLGRDVIRAMESAKVLVDLSHAHEETARDILDIATKPVGMTHTGCDAVNPHQRNKSDFILKAVANSGGVVGIYEMSYITPDLEQQSLEAFLAHITHAVNICGEDHVGIGSDTPILGFDTGAESMKMWNEINAHRKKTGVAAPGEGPPPYVVGLNGTHKMAQLGEELRRVGFKSSAVDKILGENFARLFKSVWA